jgi:cytochrome c oxidase cbb3-type subunit III
MKSLIASAFLSLAILLLAGCSAAPPGDMSEVIAPNQIADFEVLYTRNCAGCHGLHGKNGAAIALSDPVFLAITDDATIRRVASNGVPGTPMPAFVQNAGGLLTENQIDVLARGIRSWADPKVVEGIELPSYAAKDTGDRERGAEVFRTYCASCHGADGKSGKGGSVVDGSFLALVSDQELRMNVILGRPASGAPDWRNDIPGKPLAEQQITDVVAWITAQRPAIPGQPYPMSVMNRPTGGVQ